MLALGLLVCLWPWQSDLGAAMAFPTAGAPLGAATSPTMADELSRLGGHRVTVLPDGYVIEDVAGEGKPVVGVVMRRGQHLLLASDDRVVYRLAGVLARPRIAGPGYKIWVIGDIVAGPGYPVLTAYRIGVLAPPW